MKHSIARQNIIETASRLFYQKGYSLTGINEIIREASVAKATLYSHFKSKDDICIAYLNNKNETFIASFKAFVSKAPEGRAQILAMFDFLKAFYSTPAFNGCWCINTISEIPPENITIRETIQNQKNSFIKVIESFVKTNFPSYSIEENERLAKRIYLLYEGALVESHLHSKVWPIDSAKELCEYILK